MTDKDEILAFLMVATAVAVVCCGYYVVRPNLHGIKFKEGTCNITSVESMAEWDELPTCSCGKGCSEEYPCVTVRGHFWEENSSDFMVGTFHSDFDSLKKKCLFIPECDKSFEVLSERVFDYYMATISPRINGYHSYPSYSNGSHIALKNSSDFSCWGYDNHMYFSHKYSKTLVYVALILPGVAFLGTVAVNMCFGSDDQKFLPFYILALPLIFIYSVLNELLPGSCTSCMKSCWRGVKGVLCCYCCKNRNSSSQARDQSPNLSRRGSNIHMDIERRRSVGSRSDDSVIGRLSDPTSPSAREQGYGSAGYVYPPPSSEYLPPAAPAGDALPPPPSYSEALMADIAPPPGAPSSPHIGHIPTYNDVMRSS